MCHLSLPLSSRIHEFLFYSIDCNSYCNYFHAQSDPDLVSGRPFELALVGFCFFFFLTCFYRFLECFLTF